MLACEMSLETEVSNMTYDMKKINRKILSFFMSDLNSRTLFPTATVKICEPSSFDTQSSMTLCFGDTDDGEFPILLMYFFMPSRVERFGTESRPEIICIYYEVDW